MRLYALLLVLTNAASLVAAQLFYSVVFPGVLRTCEPARALWTTERGEIGTVTFTYTNYQEVYYVERNNNGDPWIVTIPAGTPNVYIIGRRRLSNDRLHFETSQAYTVQPGNTTDCLSSATPTAIGPAASAISASLSSEIAAGTTEGSVSVSSYSDRESLSVSNGALVNSAGSTLGIAATASVTSAPTQSFRSSATRKGVAVVAVVVPALAALLLR